QPPIGVAHIDSSEHVLERFMVASISVQTLIQQTGETETAPNPRCRSTFWTRDRFFPEPHRSRRGVHGERRKNYNCCKITKLQGGRDEAMLNRESSIVNCEL